MSLPAERAMPLVRARLLKAAQAVLPRPYDRCVSELTASTTWGELRSGKDRVLSNADKATAAQAIAELIWNALDANATKVIVTIERTELGAPRVVVIEDDGDGIEPGEAQDLFLTEGDSWKKDKRFSPNKNRPLHGQLGRGRLLVYAIADTAEWSSVAAVDEGFMITTLVGSRTSPTGFEVGEGTAASGPPGTRVTLTMRADQKSARVGDVGFEMKVIELMAESLHSTSDATVIWDGEPLDAESAISRRKNVDLADLSDSALHGHPVPVLTVIEWSGKLGSRAMQLCDTAGAAISEYRPGALPVPFYWTAYLKWSGFRDPELMGIADLHSPEFKHNDLLVATTKALNGYLADRLADERGSVVKEWKDEGVYPYVGEITTPLEQAERDLFEVVAVIASGSIPKRGTEQKRLSLRLIKDALRADPSRLRRGLEAVLQLDEADLESLDRLLHRTELGALIRSSHKVADRLDFVNGLGSVLYSDDTRRVFREVDQLHPMLVREPWVFGDEWDVCLSEHGLTRVVKSVVEKRGDAVMAIEPVVLEDGRKGRVDMLFHKIVPESEVDRHLVVELKRPGKLTMEHYGQLANYAVAITSHPEIAGTSTKWDFWLVGSDLDSTIAEQRTDSGMRLGLAKETDRYRLWVVRWGELLDGLRRKYESYRTELGLEPTEGSGLEYLRRVHEEYLPPHLLETADATVMPSTEDEE